MRKILALAFLVTTIQGRAQMEMNLEHETVNKTIEIARGIVSGQVTTIDNQPAAYVTITLKGTNKITTTDEQGNFKILVKEGMYTLEISMVGLQTQEKPVEVTKNKTTILNITLVEDAKKLATVIITSGKSFNERTVSLGKVSIPPMDLPQSIAVIGQNVIKDQQAYRLGDVIKNVNGVYLTTTRGSVQESFAARGYSFSSTNMFKNGFRINSGVMPEISSLEKVEILKGSAAILYGQVAPGGIINMVTKQPKFKFGGEASMRVGSYDLYKPAFDIYGPINSNIAYRINGTFESANSYRDVVNSKRYYINPSLLFKVGGRTEIIVEADYLKHEFTPDFGIGSIADTIISNLPRSKFLGASWAYNTTQQTATSAAIKHQFSDKWTLDASTAYQFYKRDYYSTERIQAKANGDWVRPLGKINADENYAAAQVNLTGHFKTKSIEHTILTGADADWSATTNFDYSFPVVTGLTANSYDQINIFNDKKYTARTDMPTATAIRKREGAISRFGIYAQDLLKLSSKFNVLAGVRWSYVDTKAIDTTALQTGTHIKGGARTDNAFSPRVGIVYKPFTTTSVFASYSNSFVVNTGQDIDGSALKPSIVDQYEIGAKNDFFKGRFSANLTLYRIINNNLAQTAPYKKDGSSNTDPNIKQLAGQTTSDGVEIDIAGQPIQGLSILAGYSYNYMRYTKTDTTIGSYKEGERLINNPAHTANASLFYTFSQSLKGIKIGVTANYIGDRFGGWNNTKGQAQKFSRLIPVAGYSTMDITAGYNYKRMTILAKVSNITNTLNYYVHENYSINPIPPRQFAATVAYKF